MRRLSLILGLMAMSLPAWGQRVKSVTVPDLKGHMVTFPVYSSPGMNNVAKADIAGGLILVNWERLLGYTPSSQLVHLVLAHEAGHLLEQDYSAQREERADYFAGRAMRIEGYTTRDMALVRYDMLRILGRGDGTHPPAAQRVAITMRGYNSIANAGAGTLQAGNSRTNPTTNPSSGGATGPYDSTGGWRHFGQNSLR